MTKAVLFSAALRARVASTAPWFCFLLPALASTADLGPAKSYSIFATGNSTASSSDVEGSVAVGGNARGKQ